MDDASATSNSGEVPACRLRRSAFSVGLWSFGAGDELFPSSVDGYWAELSWTLLTLVDLTAASSATTSSGGVRVPNFLRRTANFRPATPLRTTLQHRLALVCRSLYFFSIISITFCFTSFSPGAFGPTFFLLCFRALLVSLTCLSQVLCLTCLLLALLAFLLLVLTGIRMYTYF